ncbi:MAG: 1-acyl-sn-glycerol-3-phosphate acyltransferase [Candidatus Omnitrophica bacterium]|nr:1-acyl-sn-glycerol-3-phosphate acyltransferase [Candidatus Omnitrophota bacterium]
MDIAYRLSRLIFVVWLKLFHSLKVFGKENLPKKGPFICVPNHISFADPPVVGVACNTMPLHFMAKERLFEDKRWGWWFRWMDCIRISRDKKDYRAIKEVLKKLKEGKCAAIFPEGTRSESGELKAPELGVGFLAVKSNVPVIPFFLSGTEKALPINERYRVGVPVKVCIGKAVDFKGIEKIKDRKEKYRFVSNKIIQAIAELKNAN